MPAHSIHQNNLSAEFSGEVNKKKIVEIAFAVDASSASVNFHDSSCN